MRFIDMETWPRGRHFAFFNRFDYPHFSLCANIDCTLFHAAVKARHVSLHIALIYALGRVANAITPFRYRIRGNHVVEHDVVHPSSTILVDDDLFSFCTVPYNHDFNLFVAQAEACIARIKAHPTLNDEPAQDDRLFMTSVPWVSFTALTHPLHMHPVDSVPRIAWGKIFADGDRLKLPLSVQVHHALMDGLHVGRYYQQVQDLFAQPQHVLDQQM